MKPAILMMFRDEADILGKCLEHWYSLGVRNFYLCDNGSKDQSVDVVWKFKTVLKFSDPDSFIYLGFEYATDWPGRRVINSLKEMAINDGCDWLFPADADEFLELPPWHTLESWIDKYPTIPAWGELPYLNILPNGREYWQEPHKKACGYITKDMTISMGNHLIEGVVPILGMGGAYYKHYSIRSYEQFKRKMENYMVAFSQSPHQDHPHAQAYNVWAVEGEQYIQNRYNELMNEHDDVVAPRWL